MNNEDFIKKIQALLGSGYMTPAQERALLGWGDQMDHPKREGVEGMAGSRQVCPECRTVAPIIITCAHANKIWVGSKWRAPKKTNDRAWKRIAEGEIQWDRAAIEAKAQKQARIVLEMQANTRGNRAKRKKMMDDWHANRGRRGVGR